MGRLTADFAKAFSRDLKKNAKRRNWNLTELEKVIDLVVENTPETLEELRRRHNMHTLSGNWRGRYECHVANAGDWLVIWSSKRFGRVLRAYWQPRRIIPGKPDAERIASVGFAHSVIRQTDAYKPLTVSLSDWTTRAVRRAPSIPFRGIQTRP